MTKTVLVTGASGRSGKHAADAFAADGWTVRRFNRKTDDLVTAAKGADVIYNGMNPPNYHNWAENIPRITADVIAAAKASGATIIQPGTVYVYGDQPGVFSAGTPQRAHTRKGKIRIEMEEAYKRAARDGVQTIVLRGGDFIDPEGKGDAMEVIYLRALKKGRLTAAGDVNAVRAHCYLPDFGRAAVMLANRRETLGAYEDIPFEGHSFSVVQLKARIEWMTGQDLKLATFPWWVFRGLAPFWELARELLEMRYLWSLDHQLDGARLAALLPDFKATDFDTIMRPLVGRSLGRNISPQLTSRPNPA